MLDCRFPEQEGLSIHFPPRVGVSPAATQTLPLGGPGVGAGRPSHLVRGCLSLLGAHGILLVVGEHDQANKAAHAEDHLLAREDGVAGAAKEASAKQGDGVSRHVPKPQKAAPRPAQWVRVRSGILTHPNCLSGAGAHSSPSLCSPVFLALHSQHRSLLRAGTEVALHLSLVHSIQGEHHEDTPEGQRPESVPHKRVRIQPARDTNMSLLPQRLSLPHPPTTGGRAERWLPGRSWTQDRAAGWVGRGWFHPSNHSLIPGTKNILTPNHQPERCAHPPPLQCQPPIDLSAALLLPQLALCLL